MEWKSIRVNEDSFLDSYLLEVLVNENDEVLFAKLRDVHMVIGGNHFFELGYGVLLPNVKLPISMDDDKMSKGSYVSYSHYTSTSTAVNSENLNYDNGRVVIYDENNAPIHNQDFLSETSKNVQEMGEKELFNMDVLKTLIGKKFDDIRFNVNDLFYNYEKKDGNDKNITR